MALLSFKVNAYINWKLRQSLIGLVELVKVTMMYCLLQRIWGGREVRLASDMMQEAASPSTQAKG